MVNEPRRQKSGEAHVRAPHYTALCKYLQSSFHALSGPAMEERLIRCYKIQRPLFPVAAFSSETK